MKPKIFLIVLFLFTISGCVILKKDSEKVIKTGEITKSELTQYKWFKYTYKKYDLSRSIRDSLSKITKYKIVIVGGDWCSDTKLNLPRFIKIIDLLNFPEENLKLVFVDRSKSSPLNLDEFYKVLKIEFIPTFIVFNLEGEEIGRIVESPKISLEADLLKIINQP